MKKLCLIFALFLLIFANSVSAETMEQEMALLQAIGLMDAQTAEADEPVTRGAFARSVLRFMGIEEAPYSYDASFEDVTEYNEECYEIYYLKERKILSGAGDGNFYPDEPITQKQAAIVIARVLGYGVEPSLTEEYAKNLQLIPMSDDVLTQSELVSLLYRALECKCVEVTFDGDVVRYEMKEDYLSENFGIYQERGIVKSNSLTTLDGTGVPYEDIVVIGNHKLLTNPEMTDSLLGMSVDYYYIPANYEKTDEDRLVFVSPTKLNRVTEISARDIVSFDGKTISYEKDEHIRTLKVGFDVDVIYNGIACPDYEPTMLAPESGKLTYIENGSGMDCIIVEEYENVIVTAVTEDLIYVKNRKSAEPTAPISLEDFEADRLFFYDAQGNRVETIPVNSVLSLYYSSDKTYLKAIYSVNILDGVKVDKKDEESVFIDGTIYYLNPSALNEENLFTVTTSAKYKVYFDAFGEIAKLEKASGSVTFGYIIELYKSEIDDNLCIKMLVEDGGIELIGCASRLNIDGERQTYALEGAKEKLAGEEGLQQLVTYKTNAEGKITTITTAKNRTFTDSARNKDADVFKVSYQASNSHYKTATQVFGTTCPIDENTKIFFVAENPERHTDEFYWTGNMSALENDNQPKTVLGYNTTAQFGNAEAIVVNGSNSDGKIVTETRLSVIKEIATVINEDDEIKTRITFITSGKLVAYNLSGNIAHNMSEDITKYLSKGDIVRFAINRKYEISNLEMICDLQEDGKKSLYYDKAKYKSDVSNSGDSTFRLVSGGVYDYQDGLLCLAKGDVNTISLTNPIFEYYRGIANAFICVIEDDGDEVTAGSDADIIGYVDAPANPSVAFITTRLGAVRDIVIYK